MTDAQLEQEWKSILQTLNPQFGDLDIQGILFLIGIQELGKGYQKFKKDEKLEVMHIAICTILEPYGHYEFIGRDEEGWPHWKANEKLPPLKPLQQELLMKEAAIEYFKNRV